ncbi:hypothetical protein CS063_01440 [Sporanaerobium hydrogeniformans]|uniref:Uncharacterized protein n=1 Tax=Sporanaerobium hydrogeniformans TaxID=3072179 RepID=A0AC61DG79_9FIRM|nr:hypothetical protein [Sporanaerobium hydrogeniformans]PHV72166.1 hypothetical protein CS063_01440 [Sporanaerobium hydrogeniformans]
MVTNPNLVVVVMQEMEQKEFNYWEDVVFYQKQGHTKEESEDLAYKDLMSVFNKVCDAIDKNPKGCCVICKYSEGVWDTGNVECEFHGGLHKNDDVCDQFKEVGLDG